MSSANLNPHISAGATPVPVAATNPAAHAEQEIKDNLEAQIQRDAERKAADSASIYQIAARLTQQRMEAEDRKKAGQDTPPPKKSKRARGVE